MDHISSHMKVPEKKRKDRATERGELLKYFKVELNRTRQRDGLILLTMPRMGKIFEALSVKDLYFLKSICDQHVERGGDFSKKFWWEVDPKKHTPEALEKQKQKFKKK